MATNQTFAPSCGYATRDARREWLALHGMPDAGASLSALELTADPDTSKPLYFWQLYSLIGQKRIVALVYAFYRRVYADDEDPEFKRAFTRISGIDHHVATQAAYWIDAFGGGRQYHGSSFRLKFHHSHNAKQVMNAAGARRWMYHMGRTLRDFDPVLRAIDPRIPGCLVDFLRTKMIKYAKQFGWKYDDRDFDFARAQDPDVALHRLTARKGGARSGGILYGRGELGEMSVRDLRQLCHNLGLPFHELSKCVEKVDLLNAIAASERATVVEPPSYTLASLQRMPVKTLKQMAKCVGVSVKKCVEKSDVIQKVIRSGRIRVVDAAQQAAPSAAAAAPVPPAAPNEGA